MNMASDRLIELFRQLSAVIPQAAAAEDDLLQIREYITHLAQPNSLDESFWAFLTGILRADPYESDNAGGIRRFAHQMVVPRRRSNAGVSSSRKGAREKGPAYALTLHQNNAAQLAKRVRE
jgi:hypothetical protein